MIRDITIKAFKSLESVEIELGRVNVFIGANGSGKSNLLEAIGVLGAAAGGRVDDPALLRRGVRPGLPELYKSSFKGTRQPANIRFEANSDDGAFYAVGLYNPLQNPEPAWRYQTELLEENGVRKAGRSPNLRERLDPTLGYAALKSVELEPGSVASNFLKALQDFAIFSPDTPTLRGLELDTQSREPVGLSGGGLAEAVSSLFLRELRDTDWDETYSETLRLIGWVSGMGASPASRVPISRNIPQPKRVLRFRDRYMAEGREFLSAYDASEGALYVLFMTVLAHHSKAPAVIGVDNFDHALNPRLAKALTSKICEWTLGRKDRQFLLTSHNPLVLDGLPLHNDEVRLFTVERSSKGKTIVTRVQVDKKLIDQAKKGIPLSQQWVMGTFGGIPGSI